MPPIFKFRYLTTIHSSINTAFQRLSI